MHRRIRTFFTIAIAGVLLNACGGHTETQEEEHDTVEDVETEDERQFKDAIFSALLGKEELEWMELCEMYQQSDRNVEYFVSNRILGDTTSPSLLGISIREPNQPVTPKLEICVTNNGDLIAYGEQMTMDEFKLKLAETLGEAGADVPNNNGHISLHLHLDKCSEAVEMQWKSCVGIGRQVVEQYFQVLNEVAMDEDGVKAEELSASRYETISQRYPLFLAINFQQPCAQIE